jgi:hypothetical protein
MRLGVQFSSASLRAIKVEIRVLAQLSHPNIVAFRGACMAPPHICILEEVRPEAVVLSSCLPVPHIL